MLLQGKLAQQLVPELSHIAELKPATLLGKQCNLLQISSTFTFWMMYHNASHPLPPQANAYGLRLAGGSPLRRRRVRTLCRDLDMADLSATLAPDSFYQTLMSEHAGMIGLGLWLEQLDRTIGQSQHTRWVGSASWKHAIKGRPVPCAFMRAFNLSRLSDENVVYWGPAAGPVQDWTDFQQVTARKQVNGHDLMRAMQDQFFHEVFGMPAGLGRFMRSQGNVAHPWSNYIWVSHKAMVNLAKFNVIQATWLDLRYPRAQTAALSSFKECPNTYQHLRSQGVVSDGAQKEQCVYCRAPVWTNWHRCRMGCHRCWSYVMEQLNIFYYYFLLRPVYIHDDKKCADPFYWQSFKPPLRNFNMEFIDVVYELMLQSAHQ